jgi:hypothetical protein
MKPRAYSSRSGLDDLERRMSILKDAVRRMERDMTVRARAL